MRQPPQLNPDSDGLDHINIYSKAKTWLGREASNFARFRMAVPEHGTFNSLEGYWYWLITRDDQLRTLTGYDAKKTGRASMKGMMGSRPSDFEDRIRAAIRAKADQHLDLQRALADSTLPFTHYYVMTDRGSGARRIVDANNHPWLLHEWECIRAELRGEPIPEPPSAPEPQPQNNTEDDQYDLF